MRHAIAHLKKSDPTLAAIITRVGPFRMTYREPTYETLVRAIAFQQLNGKAAATIFGRLVEAAGGRITPQSILALTEAQMRACGLSRQKLSYIRDLAEKTNAGEVDFARLPAMPDEDVIAHLTRVKGIGVWSAQMFLIFSLRRPDIMPTADYGVLMAIKKNYRKRTLPKPAQTLKLAEPWRPYRSVACWYLWRSVDGAAG
jgi:DNA-3-methyladenine glycosylase II